MSSTTTTRASSGGGVSSSEEKLNPDWWYLYGAAYDFSDFMSRHPGGSHAISLGKGRDCTALFESYHTNLPNSSLLEKYKVLSPKKGLNYAIRIKPTPFTFDNNGFYRVLKRRASLYFEENGYKNTKGGFAAVSTFILNIGLLLFSLYMGFVRGSAIFALIYGVCKSLLVIRATHACSHYSFTTWQRLNKFVYWICMSCAGDTPAQWTAKHVLAHHIDTNVVPIDDDTMYPIKRVLPGFRREWWHSYQHIYIWFLYSFVYYPWTVSHNIKFLFGILFNNFVVYENNVICPIESIFDWIETGTAIIIHHSMRLLPFIYLPTWWQAIFIAFLAEWSSSVWFSLQFAVNHETEEACNFATSILEGEKNEKNIKEETRDWGAHQVLTSHNYSIDFLPSLHLSGGLNYQIEHHLFPSVHYKFYPDLSKIVRQTAKEFNLPYNYSKSFFKGVEKHYQLLKYMGNNDTLDATFKQKFL